MSYDLKKWLLGVYIGLAFLFFSACRQDSPVKKTNSGTQQATNFFSEQQAISFDTTAIDSLITEAGILRYAYPDSSLLLLEASFKQSAAINYYKGLAQTLMIKGLTYYEKAAYPEAIETVYKAKDFVSGPQQMAQWHLNTAVVFSRFEDAQKQLQHYFDALKELGKVKDSSSVLYATILTNISKVWGQIDEPEKRDYYYQKAITLVQNNKDKKSIVAAKDLLASLYNSRASHMLDENKLEETLAMLKKSLLITDSFPMLNRRRNEAFILSSLAYAKAGDAAKAIQFIDSYMVLNKGKDAYTTKVIPNIMRSTIALMDHNPKEALKFSDIALEQAKALGLEKSPKLLGLWEDRIEIQTKLKQFDAATFSYSILLEILDSNYNTEKVNANRTLDFIYQTSVKDTKLASNQLLIAQKNNQIYQQRIIIGLIAGGLLLALLLVYSFKKRQQSQQHLYELQRKSDEIKHLKSLTAIEEVQKRKLGAELHDGINGSMAAIKMNLSTIRKTYPELNNTPIFLETQEMLKETTDEIRQTAHALIPEMLLKNGLNQALIAHVNRISNALDFRIEYSFFMQEHELSPLANLTIYRIIQELLQNIVKHSKASAASVQLLATRGKVSLIVEDNGVGFEVHKVSTGIGLDNVKVRVLSLEGDLDIQSTPGKHTVVRVSFDQQNLI